MGCYAISVADNQCKLWYNCTYIFLGHAHHGRSGYFNLDDHLSYAHCVPFLTCRMGELVSTFPVDANISVLIVIECT